MSDSSHAPSSAFFFLLLLQMRSLSRKGVGTGSLRWLNGIITFDELMSSLATFSSPSQALAALPHLRRHSLARRATRPPVSLTGTRSLTMLRNSFKSRTSRQLPAAALRFLGRRAEIASCVWDLSSLGAASVIGPVCSARSVQRGMFFAISPFGASAQRLCSARSADLCLSYTCDLFVRVESRRKPHDQVLKACGNRRIFKGEFCPSLSSSCSKAVLRPC